MQPFAKISKVLVGIDASTEAQAAQRHALHIARRMHAELILAHACPRPEISPLSHSSPAVFQKLVLPEILGAADAGHAEERGDDSVPVGLEDGLKIAKLFIDGSPDPGIADAARDCHADLIVIGTHGRTGLRRALLGSVAERTVRRAATSVLVARGAPPDPGGYRRILVPTDFSRSSEQALRSALALAAPRCVVELVHCLTAAPIRPVAVPMPVGSSASAVAAPLGPSAPSNGPVRDQVYELAMAEGRRLVALYRHDAMVMDFHLIEERPVPAILERLESGSYDLCAVGGKGGRKGLRRLKFASVTDQILRHAGCSVLVARADEHDPSRRGH